jgi:hypothetical protein
MYFLPAPCSLTVSAHRNCNYFPFMFDVLVVGARERAMPLVVLVVRGDQALHRHAALRQLRFFLIGHDDCTSSPT